MLLAIMTFAGCATGAQEDARRAADLEATRTAVVPGAQETQVVERFFPATPSPGATNTPISVLASLVLADGVAGDGSARGETTRVSPNGRIFAVAEVRYLSPGQTIIAIWTNSSGSEVGRSSISIESAATERSLAFEWSPNGAPRGRYVVYIYADAWLLNSLVFSVS